MKYPAKALSG